MAAYFTWRGVRRDGRLPGIHEPVRRTSSVTVDARPHALVSAYAAQQGIPMKAVLDALFSDLRIPRRSRDRMSREARRQR